MHRRVDDPQPRITEGNPVDHQTNRGAYYAAALAALASRHGRHALRSAGHDIVRPYVVLGGAA